MSDCRLLFPAIIVIMGLLLNPRKSQTAERWPASQQSGCRLRGHFYPARVGLLPRANDVKDRGRECSAGVPIQPGHVPGQAIQRFATL